MSSFALVHDGAVYGIDGPDEDVVGNAKALLRSLASPPARKPKKAAILMGRWLTGYVVPVGVAASARYPDGLLQLGTWREVTVWIEPAEPSCRGYVRHAWRRDVVAPRVDLCARCLLVRGRWQKARKVLYYGEGDPLLWRSRSSRRQPAPPAR